MSEFTQWVVIASAVVVIICSCLGMVCSASGRWYSSLTVLWRTDPGAAARIRESPPWYVRFFNWADNHLSGGGSS